MLPFLTFSMTAPLNPFSKIFPPTTLRPNMAALLPFMSLPLRKIMCPIILVPSAETCHDRGCCFKKNWFVQVLTVRYLLMKLQAIVEETSTIIIHHKVSMVVGLVIFIRNNGGCFCRFSSTMRNLKLNSAVINSSTKQKIT